MRTLFIYAVYLTFSFVLMFFFYIDYFPPLNERIMATIKDFFVEAVIWTEHAVEYKYGGHLQEGW